MSEVHPLLVVELGRWLVDEGVGEGLGVLSVELEVQSKDGHSSLWNINEIIITTISHNILYTINQLLSLL